MKSYNDLKHISAVIPTRGNVDMDIILESLPAFGEVIVWNNAERVNCSVYGRYAGINLAKNKYVYTQDDDCIVWGIDALIEAFNGETGVSNMPVSHGRDIGNYIDSYLLGWGSIFRADSPKKAFKKYWREYPNDDLFQRTCDVVFSALSDFKRIDEGHESLDYAFHLDRMYHQPNHDGDRQLVLERCRKLRTSPPG